MKIHSLILVLVIFIIPTLQSGCPLYENRCDGEHIQNGYSISNCLNNKCYECDDVTKGIQTYCKKPRNYFIQDDGSDGECSSNCAECKSRAENCTVCPVAVGVVLEYGIDDGENVANNQCICTEGYLGTPPNCNPCYWYGEECLADCPKDTEKNEKYMTCEKTGTNKLQNDDDIAFIILTVVLSVIIVILTFILYRYFAKIFRQIYDADKQRALPLTDEEKFYLANQQEIERQRRIKEEELERQLAKEEEERKVEEERRRKEKEEEERRIQEEEEERRREQEEAERRKQEEEEQIRRAEEEARRQMEEEAEKRRVEEEKRLEAIAKEEERRRVLTVAREAQQQKRQERQLVKQQTMQANQQKVQALREERQKKEEERKEMEQFNEQMLKEAEQVQDLIKENESKLEEAKQREQETIRIQEQIMERKNLIAQQRQELDSQLEGVDIGSAIAKAKSLSAEDVVFIQSLKTPSQRIQMCLEAVTMITSNTHKKKSFDDIKRIVADVQFRKNMLNYDPNIMGDKVYNEIKKLYISNGQWNLTKMKKASAAIGVFAEWVEAVMKYRQIKNDNKELFDKVNALRDQERELEKDMDRLDNLQEEQKQAEEEQKVLTKQITTMNDKKAAFVKKATMNLETLKAKEQEMNALQTDNLDLVQIEESEEESDLDSDLDIEAINNKMQ